MKTLLLFSLGLCCHALAAQITLNQTLNAPDENTSYDYVIAYGSDVSDDLSISTIDFGGPNASWDLTSISGQTYTLNFGAANEGNDSEFSNSNLVQFNENPVVSSERYISIEGGDYFYDGLSVFMPGEDAPFVRTTYEDKRQFMSYPITYLDQFSDPFSGTVEIANSGQVLNQSGDVLLTADGYGTLTLPYGIVENVLRIKVTTGYFDDFMGITTSSHSDYEYFWYHQNYQTIIASYGEYYTDGLLEDRVASYITEQDFSSLVETYSEEEISIYPNPSSGEIHVEFPALEVFNYSITDLQGKTVLSGTTKDLSNKKMTLSGLETGIYILQAFNGSESFSKRLIME